MAENMTEAGTAALLASYRERIAAASTYDDWHQVGRDGAALAAALDAVLKLAAEYDVPPYFLDDVTAARRSVALRFREAIARELGGLPSGEPAP